VKFENDVLLVRRERSSELFGIRIVSYKIKFSVSFNELCGLTIYFLPYDGGECTRIASVVLCS